MKYRIVQSLSVKDLEGEVNKLIEDGWIVQGGLCLNSMDNIFYQAMTQQDKTGWVDLASMKTEEF